MKPLGFGHPNTRMSRAHAIVSGPDVNGEVTTACGVRGRHWAGMPPQYEDSYCAKCRQALGLPKEEVTK